VEGRTGNNTPLAARRSKFGVIDCALPPIQPIQSFRSSIAMNSTLGLSPQVLLSFPSLALAPPSWEWRGIKGNADVSHPGELVSRVEEFLQLVARPLIPSSLARLSGENEST
jgi:hypothetical protein